MDNENNGWLDLLIVVAGFIMLIGISALTINNSYKSSTVITKLDIMNEKLENLIQRPVAIVDSRPMKFKPSTIEIGPR